MAKHGFAALAACAAALAWTTPAAAQFFLKSPDFRGSPVTGTEPGLGVPLPDAKPEELRAGLVWNMRAALNVAALQCQFEPTLLTLNQYNYLISDHKQEFADAYKTLGAYFRRTTKNPKAAQTAIDQYGTRTYAGFSTVQSQLGFCMTASKVGREALFARKGELGTIAARHMRELRNSLVPAFDQQFPRFRMPAVEARLLPLDKRCWDGKNNFRASRCPLVLAQS